MSDHLDGSGTARAAHRARRRTGLRLVGAAALAFAVIVGAVALVRPDLPGGGAAPARRACVYTAHSIAAIERFERLLGAPVRCALVYNDVARTWADWERPWFTVAPPGDEAWAAWARAGDGRSLVISQSLVATDELAGDWRAQGAAGAFDDRFRTLAGNLVDAGLGAAVIRLAPEANDTANPNTIGATADERAHWRAFWARAVAAMRSVPGAAFHFDWCVNAYWQPVPLDDWYPGDASVDIIGVDVYDSGVPPLPDRWARIRDRPVSVAAVAAFARERGRPLSIPEWALVPTERGGAGDDPGFITGVADVVRDEAVEYQSYWFAREYADLLEASPRATAVLRDRFGPGGDAAPSR